MTKPSSLSRVLGPGLIAGASDDDPSGIATYSQAGAQYGYALGWVMLFSWPLMSAIQEISARIGRVTGKGIAANLAEHSSRPVVVTIVTLLSIANVINLGADLGAMGAALQLLVGGEVWIYVLLFGALSATLEIFSQYSRYVSLLKWLSLSLLAYVAVALSVDVPWGTVARGLVMPDIEWSSAYLTVVVAILGTTISPYLFFWQAQEEVEDIETRDERRPLRENGGDDAASEFRRINLDTIVGMGISNLVALFIIVTTAATLHAHGVTDVQTSSDAASALEPIAGKFAYLIFALGIIGTGLLALPVLAASAAYAVGEVAHWTVGLSRKPREAKAFYAAIVVATALGIVMINLTSLDPIKALFWSAVINGVVAVPVMFLMMRLGSKREAMGDYPLPPLLKWLGWITTLVMAAAAAGMVFADL